MKRIEWKRVLGVALLYALAGPMAGATAALAWLAINVPGKEAADGLVLVMFWPFALVLGMIIGFLPGLLTGLVMGLASSRLKPGWLWVAASTVVGCALAGLAYLISDPSSDIGLFMMAGAAAGFVCALISLRWRPGGRTVQPG